MNKLYKFVFWFLFYTLMTLGSMYIAGKLCVTFCSGPEFEPMIKAFNWMLGTGVVVGIFGIVQLIRPFLTIKVKK